MSTAAAMKQEALGEDTEILSDLPTERLEQDTKIKQWGYWSRGGLPALYSGRTGPTPTITDDMAIRIDRIVAGGMPMKCRIVMELMYREEYGRNELAEKLAVSTSRIDKLRDQGLNIVWGALYGIK